MCGNLKAVCSQDRSQVIYGGCVSWQPCAKGFAYIIIQNVQCNPQGRQFSFYPILWNTLRLRKGNEPAKEKQLGHGGAGI